MEDGAEDTQQHIRSRTPCSRGGGRICKEGGEGEVRRKELVENQAGLKVW
jgi:hypothetical protein